MLIGGAAVAAVPVVALVNALTKQQLSPTSQTYPLNADWMFGPYAPGLEHPAASEAGLTQVSLPHTTAEMSWRGWDPAAWQQVWLYRRHLDMSGYPASSHPQRRVFADFDGAMVNATVYCNDQALAYHQGGYLPFSAELTNVLRQAGDNILAVILDSRSVPVPPIGIGVGPASIDFLQPGGIYRDVNLRVVPQTFISDLSVTTANVLTSQPVAEVTVRCDAGPEASGEPGTLLIELLDQQGHRLASHTQALQSGKARISTATATLTAGNVSLWAPDTPNLYTVRATLSVKDQGTHQLTRNIGFREASFRPDGFYLNGKRLQIFGLDRHQLYPYAGMAMPARVQRKDAEILKNEFNCNMVRCSHYPQSPHFLDACDELGLLVWEEAPGWHTVSLSPSWQAQVVANVKDMVTRDRSRPSVVIWGTRLNETSGHPALWAATRQAARQLDPTRASSGAMDTRHDATWSEDVFAFNDYSTTAQGNARLQPPVDGVPYLITESVGVVEEKPRRFAWTDTPYLLARQAALHAQAHSAARTESRYSGLLAWLSFDYPSLQARDPENIKWAGVADGFRVPKPGAAIYRAQIDPNIRGVISPAFFWESTGATPAVGVDGSGHNLIASNCEQLEISIGGTRVGTALPAAGNPLYRNLPYPPFLVSLPGTPQAEELLIQGFVNGQQVAELRMSADPAADYLGLAADDTQITADGSDATRVVFRALDAYGNQRRYQAGQVKLTLTGPGTLIGDNPFAFGAYGGLGAVWLRSLPGQSGLITLTAVHPALGSARVQVTAT
jgi:beta-galactosidase